MFSRMTRSCAAPDCQWRMLVDEASLSRIPMKTETVLLRMGDERRLVGVKLTMMLRRREDTETELTGKGRWW